MIWMIRRVWRDFPTYEPAVKYALIVGLGLVIISLLVFFWGVPEVRIWAAIGLGGVITVMEIAVLYANRRRMVTPYTQAQRAYLSGDFAGALHTLEQLRRAGRADMRALTLLGNTYRQVGRLSESREILYEAVDSGQRHHFPLYGLGRTLLSNGEYAEAVAVLTEAVTAGAPPVVQLDVIEAFFRAGQLSEARALLSTLTDDPTLGKGAEPYRVLIAAYLRWRLLDAPPPPPDVIAAGLPFWEAAQQRFATSPYSAALAADLALLTSTA